jgi:hypothetical protein
MLDEIQKLRMECAPSDPDETGLGSGRPLRIFSELAMLESGSPKELISRMVDRMDVPALNNRLPTILPLFHLLSFALPAR